MSEKKLNTDILLLKEVLTKLLNLVLKPRNIRPSK